MGVTVCLPLFGNPGQELEEGAPVKGQQLRELATQLQERLGKAADILDNLARAGWSTQLAMYDAILFHPHAKTHAEVLSLLQPLGIDPEMMMIVEDVAEEDDELE
jgi:hypothetical protein